MTEKTPENKDIRPKDHEASDDTDRQAPEDNREILEEQEKDTKQLVIMILVLIGVFVALFVGSYIVMKNQEPPEPETREYHSFLFVKEMGLWRTEWQLGDTLYTLRMHYGPWELENVTVVGDLDERFHQDRIFITFDPYEEDLGHIAVAAGELSLNLFKAIQKYPVAACTAEHPDCEERPILNCSTTNSSVILLRSAPHERVLLEGNCLIVQGEDHEIVRAAERALYQWYQIMR
ncbi:hypothetical protein GF351_05290 [Candidatus Woesearchaeota archaeon]|nr:hypothetical protein [Candidatus Woesearchaeota archaeon]